MFVEEEVEALADVLRIETESRMKIQLVPWIASDVMNMEELYTELEIEQLENTTKTAKRTHTNDYRELFKEREAGSDRPRKGRRERVLVKADPGSGKTTFSRKIAWDWAKEILVRFTIVFFVSMKFVQPNDKVENFIIQQTPILEDLEISERNYPIF